MGDYTAVLIGHSACPELAVDPCVVLRLSLSAYAALLEVSGSTLRPALACLP